MDDDLLLGHDVGAELVDQLLLGGLTVAAGGDEDSDVGVGVALADLRQHLGHDDLAGHGTGVVAGDDDNLLLALSHDGQLGGADGVLQGLTDQLLLGQLGLVVVHLRGQDGAQPLLGNVNGKGLLTVRELNDGHGYFLLHCVGR